MKEIGYTPTMFIVVALVLLSIAYEKLFGSLVINTRVLVVLIACLTFLASALVCWLRLKKGKSVDMFHSIAMLHYGVFIGIGVISLCLRIW